MKRGHGEADWALSLLACPQCGRPVTATTAAVHCPECGVIGALDQGIYRFGVRADDEATNWFVAKGGSDFHARMQIPYTMSSLDAPVYRRYLEALKPTYRDGVIVDVGAADGRNTEPFLEWGYRRLVATDVSLASLIRLRQRVARDRPEWLDRLLLIECDARRLPLISDCADVVLSTEVLYYLNEDYGDGLRSCTRILKPAPEARLLVSERSWEGGLVNRLLYCGVAGLGALKDSRYLLDGPTEHPLRTRTFTEEELAAQFHAVNLTILERKGMPLLSLLLGYLRGQGVIGSDHQRHLPEVQALLTRLSEVGVMRRTHVLVAHKTCEV
jgi:SAM-dependent methyltransferase